MPKYLRTILTGAFLATAAVALYGFTTQTGSESEKSVIPVHAAAIESASSDTTAVRAWLHVEVETNWGWFWQKSTGRAFTTSSKDAKDRVKVGLLCIKLEAHKSDEKCLQNADSIGISEKVNGIGVEKKTAKVIAWAEHPHIEADSVSLNP
jgi:hypothetical protein